MDPLKKALFYRIDGVLLLLYAMLVITGIAAIYSVDHRATDTALIMMHKNYMKQVMWFGYSLVLGFAILLTDSKFFSSTAFLAYTLALALLVFTIFGGVDVKGSRSWLGVGSFRFQPGEVAKIFTALALAKFMSLPETNFKTLKNRLIAAAIALVPALLIILQKETGLALVYFSFFLVMYREGLPNTILIIGFSIIALVLATLIVDRKPLFIALTVLGVIAGIILRQTFPRRWGARVILVAVWLVCITFSQIAVPFVFKHVLQKHQIERIYSTIGKEVPDEYNKALVAGEEVKKGNSSEYNVLQSKIAIGSGGLCGVRAF
jgi:rod shape determining protein RodA